MATVEIPGAFRQEDMKGETVHMKMEGMMVKILTKIDPKLYRKYIRTEKGKSVLYIELKNVLYGTLQEALLFWWNLNSSLQEWVFKINPYDWCISIKTVNEKNSL